MCREAVRKELKLKTATLNPTGMPRNGNVWLKTALTEAAWAASHTKDTYLTAQCRHITRHRGKKRAVVAVGHSILTASYHLLSQQDVQYEDLGPEHFQTTSKHQLAQSLLRRPGNLGYNVTIQAAA